MAKPRRNETPTQAVPEYLPWPTHPKEVSPVPRLYRIHRVDAFAWQAYVLDPTDPEGEKPIGKADLFEIVSFKVKNFQKIEGQAEYLANKTKKALESEKKHDAAFKK